VAAPPTHAKATPEPPYWFGRFELDPIQKTLTRNKQRIPLTPKVFDTLLALVRHQGRVVSKEDLMREIWPETFVEEANLAQNISVIRKALGADFTESAFIETIPKRGYRFVAPVQRTADLRPRVPLARIASIAAAIAGLAIAVIWLAWTREQAVTRVIFAVVPFTNAGADEGDEYLAEGMTEELTTQLGRLQPGRVAIVGRASVAQYVANRNVIAGLAGDLKVRYVIEGSVRREGSHIRVSVRLVAAPDGALEWAETYEQDLGEALPMQIRLTRGVLSRIQTLLGLPPRDRTIRAGTENPRAFELYLKARHAWGKRTIEAANQAIALYEAATALDPQFAQAYAEMSRAYLSTPRPTPIDSYRLAADSARVAIALDDRLAEAHFALATAALHQFDWPTAQREFERAEDLDHGFRNVDFMLIFGHFDDAIALTRRGSELDTQNLLARHGAGINAFYARRYDEAIAHFLDALELDPQYIYSRLRLAHTLTEVGRYDEAVTLLKGAGEGGLGGLGYLYGRTNRREEALAVLELLNQLSPTGFTLDKALVNAGLGDRDAAFHWLNAAYDDRSYQLIYLKVDPRLDALRDDPRYVTLLRRIGFPGL
jgi:DNA-binding winged helix-turn-helix (wHTH) protein/TolB-like protein